MRGFVRKRGSTYTWYFDVPDPVTGKRRQYSKGGFRTKKECQHALNDALAALRTGTFVEPSQQRVAGFLVGGVAARHAPTEGPALHLAQLPAERRAAHRSRPRPPPAPTTHPGTADRLL
jgi:hypothetical protein